MSGAAPLGIDPRHHDAVVFDLDGVLTDTASVHAAAWRQLFDAYLAARPDSADEDHSPFTDADYLQLVDGKPRDDGVADFLASRGIYLPHGEPTDDPDAETVWGLGNRKNGHLQERMEADGVDVFPTSVALVVRLAALGIDVAVFSSSRNAAKVLEAAGIAKLFSVRVDGVTASELGLAGKPEPAVPLEAARRLGAEPSRTVLVEDAISGVQAGRAGGFGLVVGVAREGGEEALREHGADLVVSDLGELPLAVAQRPLSQVPDALERWDQLAVALRHLRPAVFLDFDGTLAPIVDDPAAAASTPAGQAALERLADVCDVAVVSGRGLDDLRERVEAEGLWYAGSHGFELLDPAGELHERDDAADALPALDAAEGELGERLAEVPGARLERKRYAIAAHYRHVAAERAEEVPALVEEVGRRHEELRTSGGRAVAELRPDIDWHKGRALRWLMERIAPGRPALPIYVGDDLTDEDALAEIAADGLGVVVRSEEHGDRPTAAHVSVESPEAVAELLRKLAALLEEG